jgi:hypothetical protein
MLKSCIDLVEKIFMFKVLNRIDGNENKSQRQGSYQDRFPLIPNIIYSLAVRVILDSN